MATGVLRTCAELGRRVPDDVAVTGADDVLLASLVTPALTALRSDRQAIGATALRTLLDQLHGAQGVCNTLQNPLLAMTATALRYTRDGAGWGAACSLTCYIDERGTA